jgi:hypothetical protein
MNNVEGGMSRRMHKLLYEAGRSLNVQVIWQSYVGSEGAGVAVLVVC